MRWEMTVERRTEMRSKETRAMDCSKFGIGRVCNEMGSMAVMAKTILLVPVVQPARSRS